jgi:hypothetical protein
MAGTADDGGAEQLQAQLTRQLSGLGDRLDGAVYDSDDIWELRHAWRRCVRELSALGKAMERWRLGFDELQGLDLQRLMPGLGAFGDELETRFAAIEAMLAGQAPQQQPRAVELRLDRDQLRAISHFQRAAVLLSRDQLARIDGLTQALFESVSEIRNYGRAKVPARSSAPTLPSGVIDLDHLAVTVRQSAALWLTLLMAIYVPAFPNPVGVVALTNAFAMILGMAPHVPAAVLFLPTLLGAAFAGILYLFVMPHLSGFGELAVMIFAATFLIGYVFRGPRAASRCGEEHGALHAGYHHRRRKRAEFQFSLFRQLVRRFNSFCSGAHLGMAISHLLPSGGPLFSDAGALLSQRRVSALHLSPGCKPQTIAAVPVAPPVSPPPGDDVAAAASSLGRRSCACRARQREPGSGTVDVGQSAGA